jgi:methyl-accepting chemotaxis protein
MDKKYKRRNFFIKKEMQGKYIFSFFIFIIFTSVLYASIFSMLSADSFTIVYKDNNLTIGKTPLILFAELLKANWIIILLGGIAGVIIAMFLTHRFAGPIYRLERSVQEMSGGNLAFDVTLRKSDDGKELAAALNGFKNELAGRIGSMREVSDAIDINLKRAMDYGPDMQEQARSILDETKLLNEKLRKTLDEYTIKKP